MQRPVMNPMFLHEVDSPSSKKLSLWGRLLRLPQLIARVLLVDVRFWQAGSRLHIEDASPLSRVARGLVYRLLFVPVALSAVAAILVWLGTHPPTIASLHDPLSHGIHYDPMSFVSSDGARLESWFIPVLDARVVVDKKDQALRTKYPAVVLAHDFGAGRHQMLPLVQPLHAAGYAVLVVGLRGSSGIPTRGCAFGLREYADIQAAVEMLRRRPGVDPRRIAILGVGTGANAVLLAAERDPQIAAIIVDRPIVSIGQLVAEHISPPQPWLHWMRPLCKWTFEMAYRVDAEDLEMQRRRASLYARPVLLFDSSAGLAQCFREAGLNQIKDFLAKHMPQPVDTQTAGVEVKELK